MNPKWNKRYFEWLRKWAKENSSDGCTGVADIHIDCCWQHDFAYRTGLDAWSWYNGAKVKVDRASADAQFRKCIQSKSKLGRFSPLSWARWLGVRLFGGEAWKGD